MDTSYIDSGELVKDRTANAEAESYFNGDKSVKEVVKIIKSKAGLYLAERR